MQLSKRQKGKFWLEIQGETCWCGESSPKPPTALRSCLSSPGKAQVGLWVFCGSITRGRREKSPLGDCRQPESGFWRMWFSRTSCCFLQITVRWEILQQQDFHDFSLNFCFCFVLFLIFSTKSPSIWLFRSLCSPAAHTEVISHIKCCRFLNQVLWLLFHPRDHQGLKDRLDFLDQKAPL